MVCVARADQLSTFRMLVCSRRPPGSQNKITVALKEAILAAAVSVCWVAGKSPPNDAERRREIEGVTPKQLPAPAPVLVENNDQLICVEKPSQNSASDDQ